MRVTFWEHNRSRKKIRNVFMERLMMLSVFIFLAVTAAETAVAGFHVKDGLLLDAYDNPFIMRGVNHPHVWYAGRTKQAILDIARIKANCVRVVLGSGGQWGPTPANEVADIIRQLKENKLIAVLEVHDVTGYPEKSEAVLLDEAVDYWLSIRSALEGQEDYVIVNIGNEPLGNGVPREMWSDIHIDAINKLRRAGLEHTLMVDAANWGQDWEKIMLQDAPDVFRADPLSNIVFSVHMYQVYANREDIDNYLSTFVNTHKLPLVVGEFGADHAGEDVDEASILELCAFYNIGYLGWSWSGNSGGVESLDITLDFNLNTLSPWGNFLINSDYGIKETSQPATVYTGGVGGVFPPNAAGQSLVLLEGSRASITLAGNDLDGQIVTYDITSAPLHGTLSGTGQTRVYAPDSGYTGNDVFQFTVTDDDGAASKPSTVKISVLSSGGVNGKPACEVNYDVDSVWEDGAVVNVTVTNNLPAPIDNWMLGWVLGEGETGTGGWNAEFSQINGRFVASATSENDRLVIKAGDSVSFGFRMTKGSGPVRKPDHFDLNGLTCAGGSGGLPPVSQPDTNSAPTASFTYTGGDMLVSFDASSSSDADQDQLSYHWDFGDGNTGSGVNVTHTYIEEGYYEVELTVSDGAGSAAKTELIEAQRHSQTPVINGCNDAIVVDENAPYNGASLISVSGNILLILMPICYKFFSCCIYRRKKRGGRLES